MSKFGFWNVEKDKILYPRFGASRPENLPELNKNLGYEIVERFEKTLEKFGDFDAIINGFFEITGKTSTCGSKKKTLKDLIEDSKKIGANFWQKGLKKGDKIHLLLSNSTEYHTFAIGAWLCEAIVSCGDPQASVQILKVQIQDLNPKFIICYENSRNNLHQALIESEKSPQIIVLEKSCPNSNEDLPIFENNFTFFHDFCQENLEKPPELQDKKLENDEVFLILWTSGTTGIPKGTFINHMDIISSILTIFWPLYTTSTPLLCHF